jgi:hypothetical protein
MAKLKDRLKLRNNGESLNVDITMIMILMGLTPKYQDCTVAKKTISFSGPVYLDYEPIGAIIFT